MSGLRDPRIHQGRVPTGGPAQGLVPPPGAGSTKISANRRCDQCGGAMPNRMSRQRNERGQLVCDNCKGMNVPEWQSTHAANLLLTTPEQRAEFYRREAEAVSSILRVQRWKDTIGSYSLAGDLTMDPKTGDLYPVSDLMRLAHDMGDGAIINHCPMCGSGAVVGGSDGSAECGFCHTVFTVQVQPQNPSMPQTVDGQPHVPPGMPAGDPTEMSSPTDPVSDKQDEQGDPRQDADEGAQPPPGHPTDADPNPSSADMIDDKAKDDGDPTKGHPNPFEKKDKPGDTKTDNPLDKKDPQKGEPAGQSGSDKDAPGDTDKDKTKSLPPWMKKKKSSSASAWEPFTFYNGTLTGWRQTVNGTKYEVIPTNGRAGSWDVLENDQWVGETFPSPDAAKAWVDGSSIASVAVHHEVGHLKFFTASGDVLEGEDYVRHLALRYADEKDEVLEEVRRSR